MSRREISNRLPECILGTALLCVFGSLVLFYSIDLRDVFGVGSSLGRLFFWHWWRNGGPIEWLQWSCLGAAALVSAFLSGQMHHRDRNASSFWGLIAVALVLMLIEDAGDPRHRMREYVQYVFSEGDDQGIMGTFSELLYFAALASIIIYTLVRYRHVILGHLRTRTYITIGFVSYAVAASLSFVGSAFSALVDRNFYHISGGLLTRLAVRLGDAGLPKFWLGDNYDFVAFSLMDAVVEESIELLGAAAFLAAAVSYLLLVLTNNKKLDAMGGAE